LCVLAFCSRSFECFSPFFDVEDVGGWHFHHDNLFTPLPHPTKLYQGVRTVAALLKDVVTSLVFLYSLSRADMYSPLLARRAPAAPRSF